MMAVAQEAEQSSTYQKVCGSVPDPFSLHEYWFMLYIKQSIDWLAALTKFSAWRMCERNLVSHFLEWLGV